MNYLKMAENVLELKEDQLNDFEYDFILDMVSKSSFTPNQQAKIKEIHSKYMKARRYI